MSSGKDRATLARAKKLFQEFYNIPEGTNPKTRRKYLLDALESYEGFNTATESEELAKFFKFNINYYWVNPCFTEEDKPCYELVEQVIIDESYKYIHLLRIPTGNNTFHIDRITNIEALAGIKICPHCNSYCYDPKKNHNLSRFTKHMKECEANGGKIIREVKLDNVAKPYAPHIQKQKIYAFLLAHGLAEYYRPTQNYITFDFETLEDPVNEELTEHTTIDANLKPFMVSSVVRLGDNRETQNFNLPNDGEDFINKWIEYLFIKAEEVAKLNISQYDKVYELLPKEAQGEFIKLVNSEFSTTNIIGFNSGKFDLNLILANLCSRTWRIKTIIGSSSQYKMVSVFKLNDEGNISEKHTGLRFIDIRNYIAGGTLDQFTRDFGNNNNRVKSFFPYQFITTQNWEDELYKSEPFTQDSFYSALTKTTISDEDYKIYLEDMKGYKNRLEYFIHYCNKDVEIMIDPIDNIINETFEYKIDMLHNLSLSSNASMIRYSLAYNDFDINAFYPGNNEPSSYNLTKKQWEYKVKSYEQQDIKGKRDISDNVKVSDYEYYHDLILASKCYLCGEPFTYDNKPTLDRIDNKKGHSKLNCKLCCEYCNVVKSDRDEKISKLFINLRKYAIYNHLPMTLRNDQKEAYHILRDGITGGLSNVQHRVNLRGFTKINKLYYNPETNTVYNKDTNNIMSHFVGVDFNSLYPSVFSSNSHPFIKYTGGKMYMPGRLVNTINCYNGVFKKKALNIINRKDTLFVAVVKGHIKKEYINDYINFLPIFRNIDITTDKETIGDFMYDYLQKNNIKTDTKERKLTQLADTYGEYMSFSSYYLWYLMDRFHFVIDDIKTLLVFDKNTCFNKFANTFMENRQKAELEGKKGKGLFCKISLNGSYGYDAMNTENYTQSRIENESRASCSALSNKYRSMREIGNKTFQVMIQNEKYDCKTCLQEAFFTLDNAKYWYLTFIYDFMFKCMDTRKLHFIEGDTDSMYWAIAGNLELGNDQAFSAIITNKKFYDKYIYDFAPYDFFCFDEKNKPQLKTKAEQKAHEKKLLGLAIEKQGDNMVALCPKCYTSFNEEYIDPETMETIQEAKTIALKMKGVNKTQNKHISPGSYLDILDYETTFDGENVNLTLKTGKMPTGERSLKRLTIGKTALTGKHTKAVVHANGCCMPFIKDAKYISEV